MISTTSRRGQATTELALSSLVLVSIMCAGIYFGEVTFGSLKVTEAGASAMFDMTHYKVHRMTGILYSTNPQVTTAANKAQTQTQADYQDFDGRSSKTGGSTLTQVMTNSQAMQVNCRRGGATSFNPNILGILSYSDNGGANCTAQATFATGPNMPRDLANDSGGFFKERNWSRPQLIACANGVRSGGGCRGKFATMLDDWGLTGPAGGEWMPCPGLPFGFGIPCPTNLSYWWTAFKAYLTSYTLNALLGKFVMFQMPASIMSQWVAFANPMGGFAGLIAFPLSGNESTFYLSFTGSLPTPLPFEQPLWVREGFAFWETTPFGVSLAIPYAVAFAQRVANGGCYLGKKCN